jgi:hypothetical protein
MENRASLSGQRLSLRLQILHLYRVEIKEHMKK